MTVQELRELLEKLPTKYDDIEVGCYDNADDYMLPLGGVEYTYNKGTPIINLSVSKKNDYCNTSCYEDIELQSYLNEELSEKYHESRIIFSIDGDNRIHITSKPISHKEWFTQLGLDADDIMYSCIRGNIRDNIITFYKGEDFEETKLEYFDILDLAKQILLKAEQKYLKAISKFSEYEIYDGVEIGEVGNVWKPLCKIDKLSTKDIL